MCKRWCRIREKLSDLVCFFVLYACVCVCVCVGVYERERNGFCYKVEVSKP